MPQLLRLPRRPQQACNRLPLLPHRLPLRTLSWLLVRPLCRPAMLLPLRRQSPATQLLLRRLRLCLQTTPLLLPMPQCRRLRLRRRLPCRQLRWLLPALPRLRLSLPQRLLLLRLLSPVLLRPQQLAWLRQLPRTPRPKRRRQPTTQLQWLRLPRMQLLLLPLWLLLL